MIYKYPHFSYNGSCVKPVEEIVTLDSSKNMAWNPGNDTAEEYHIALTQYKTEEQIKQENPEWFFDFYGNFCNGKGDHLAPIDFKYFGKNSHTKYLKSNGVPKDTWYYKVIDY